MVSNYVIQEKKNYLVMHITGQYKYREFLQYPQIIRRHCESSEVYRIIVDLAGVTAAEVSTPELFFLGEKLAQHLGKRIKIALVWNGKKESEFLENVATNRRANIRVFTRPERARTWLFFDHEGEPSDFKR